MVINILETLSVTLMYIVNMLNSLVILNYEDISLSLGDVIEFSMIMTIVLWIVGGMVRHNGNS